MKKQAAKEEKLYSVREAAERLNAGRMTATRIFTHEPGVLNIGRDGGRSRLRIPESVLDRVIRRRSVA